MIVTKAVITAAAPRQRTLPLQTLVDRDGEERAVLAILLQEVVAAGIEEVCIVVQPGDEAHYAGVAGDHVGRLSFAVQREPAGYGQAISLAATFTGNDPFLHLVGDHLFVSRTEPGSARRLINTAVQYDCAVSAVQPSRENLLPYYGVVGGRRIAGKSDLYQIETVMEKPTPTEAEQKLVVPGLRSGYYLCFFGMHVLTPAVMEILAELTGRASGPVSLSQALAELPGREQYLAVLEEDWRYDLGVKYGLFRAQLALAMAGSDREELLTDLVRFFADRELKTGRG